MRKRRFTWVAIAVTIAAIAGISIWTVMRTLADPNVLWNVAQSCVAEQNRAHLLSGACVAVDPGKHVAILRSIGGRWEFLAVPTIKVTGIEDPQLKNPQLPNYWAVAWAAANKYLPAKATSSRERIGLAINSLPGRSQDQLHIHISCMRRDITKMLEADQAQIGTTWSRPLLRLGPQTYRVLRIDAPTLDNANPFLLLMKLPGASENMGLHTLVVTGATWNHGKSVGFYVLDDYAHRWDDNEDSGHGEDLLDKSCG